MIQLKGKQFSVSNEGLVSFVIRYHCDTEDEALSGVPSEYRGLRRYGRNGSEWDPDADQYIVQVTYQGLLASEPTEEDDDFAIDAELREEPIEAFPDRALLESNYGAYIEDGRLKFPETLSGSGKGSTGLSSGKNSKGKNPLFGVTTYPVMRMIASQKMVRRTTPASIYSDVGRIVKSLPSGFDEPGNKTWIVDAPQVQKRGNARVITKRWKDIDPIKHVEALYTLIRR